MLMSPCKVVQVFLDCSALWDCNCNGHLTSNNVLAQFVMSVFVDLKFELVYALHVRVCMCVRLCVACVCVCLYEVGKRKIP